MGRRWMIVLAAGLALAAASGASLDTGYADAANDPNAREAESAASADDANDPNGPQDPNAR